MDLTESGVYLSYQEEFCLSLFTAVLFRSNQTEQLLHLISATYGFLLGHRLKI